MPAATTRTQAYTKKYLGGTLFPRYFYYIFHPNYSLKWMKKACFAILARIVVVIYLAMWYNGDR